jgi:hypothetical protein
VTANDSDSQRLEVLVADVPIIISKQGNLFPSMIAKRLCKYIQSSQTNVAKRCTSRKFTFIIAVFGVIILSILKANYCYYYYYYY